MSITFRLECHTCDAGLRPINGPALDRKAGGTALLAPDEWQQWLTEHAYHDLRLRTE